MKQFLAVGALLLILGASARADQFSAAIYDANSNSGFSGTYLDNSQYAGTFTVQDTTQNSGTFNAFCADLTDHVYFGPYGYSGTPFTGGLPSAVPGPVNVWSGSAYATDLGSRLNYVLTQVMAPAESNWPTNSTAESRAEAAAVQTVIWNLMGNYGYSGGNSNTVDSYVQQLMTLVGTPGNNGSTSGVTAAWLAGISAYSQNHTGGYASSSEFLVVPSQGGGPTGDNQLNYQVLVGINPGGHGVGIQGVAPEPSTLAIACLGALGFIGYGLRRRKSA